MVKIRSNEGRSRVLRQAPQGLLRIRGTLPHVSTTEAALSICFLPVLFRLVYGLSLKRKKSHFPLPKSKKVKTTL